MDVSRDGRNLVYNSAQHIYLQRMDRVKGEPIQGTTGDSMEPVLSPDGAWLAFFDLSGRKLQKIAVGGGSPITLADLPATHDGASWHGSTIVFAMTDGQSRASSRCRTEVDLRRNW